MATNKPKFLIFDETTNQETELDISSGSFSPELTDAFNEPVSVCNSYKFECSFKGPALNIQDLWKDIPGYKDACRLADELNDLIEEYHAPGTPRRERRAIKREFDRIFRIFRKHCYTHRIDFRFERPNK